MVREILAMVCLGCGIFVMLGSCTDGNNLKNSSDMEREKTIFGLGEQADNYFTGKAWVKMIETKSEFDCNLYNVTFESGARNYWHSHSVGQILLCTDGVGVYQAKGDSARILNAGDVVNIPANVTHWHGAALEGNFTHIGISPRLEENKTEWFSAVSDSEYNEAIK